MDNYIFSKELVDEVVAKLGIQNLGHATIGEVVLLAQELERRTGIPFIRMDQGVPGLPPCIIGLEAEKKALDTGVAAIYPPADGIPPLKQAASRFVKAFLDIEISPRACIPVVGSVAGSFGSLLTCTQIDETKDTVLLLDPGFPIHKSQLRIFGGNYESFDIYRHRGEALRVKLEEYFSKGNICALLYSNPNNPAWISLTEAELKIVGELATKYDIIVLEDLAYLGMDNREYFGEPGKPPFIPTAARYTDSYIIMLSSSKIFSYAGQRAALLCLSDKIFARRYPALAKRYSTSGGFGATMVNAILYMITSGVTHTVQYGYAAMLKAASEGRYDFVEETSAYAERARRMKEMFERNGFHIVYDKDIDRKIGDGFFFTIGYRDMDCSTLMSQLLHYGISSITLVSTGSGQKGIRACTSRMSDEQYPVLEERLKAFDKDHTK